MKTTPRSHLRLFLSALAIAAPRGGVRAEAAEETHGDWRVVCGDQVRIAY
jgi:hypothetical protein